MSVTRLSEIDPMSSAEKVEQYEAGIAEERAAREAADNKLDQVVGKALEHLPDDDAPEPPRKPLDELISGGLDKLEAEQSEREAWSKSAESREELDTRYAKFDANTAKTLDRFLDMADALKASPGEAAVQIAENYLRASRYSLLGTTPEKKDRPEATFDSHGNRRNEKVLDHIIEQSIEKAGAEKDMYEATKSQRERLKALWPDLSFDAAMKRMVEVDRRLHQDPLVAAAELGAAFGMPVLPHQYEAKAERDQADAVINVAVQHLPGLRHAEVRRGVASILEHPQFVSSGNAQVDLQRAYQVQQHLARQNHQIGAYVEAELSKMPSGMAAVVADVIMNDKTFAAQADRNIQARPFGDSSVAVRNFELARGIAMQKARALSKAQRVKPVKSSSGAMPSGANKSDGLDAAISRAMQGRY